MGPCKYEESPDLLKKGKCWTWNQGCTHQTEIKLHLGRIFFSCIFFSLFPLPLNQQTSLQPFTFCHNLYCSMAVKLFSAVISFHFSVRLMQPTSSLHQNQLSMGLSCEIIGIPLHITSVKIFSHAVLHFFSNISLRSIWAIFLSRLQHDSTRKNDDVMKALHISSYSPVVHSMSNKLMTTLKSFSSAFDNVTKSNL